MSKTFEHRMSVSGLEVREAKDTLTLTGYASTFNQSYPMGWYDEDVDPQAFKRTLGAKPDVRYLVNHTGLPFARTRSGSLVLDADSKGLIPMATLQLSDPDVQALAPKVLRGDVDQMSFSFRLFDNDSESWSKDMSRRTLRSLDLNDGDVSLVTYPANPNTLATARSGDRLPVDGIASVFRMIESRDVAPEDIASVLTRALAYFSAIDLIADEAQEDLAEALNIPNPDCEAEDMTEDMPMPEAKAAAIAHELRSRLLVLAG